MRSFGQVWENGSQTERSSSSPRRWATTRLATVTYSRRCDASATLPWADRGWVLRYLRATCGFV